MSADNGVYILKTPAAPINGADEFEYRVAHLAAVENYTWARCPVHGSDMHYGNDGREHCALCPQGYSENPNDHILNAREMWADSRVFFIEASALVYAASILRGLEICEYGISFVEIDRVW